MKIEPDQMALLIHCPGQYIFILGIAPKQPKTQALCRSILNRYPELAGKEWAWQKGDGLSHGKDKIKFVTPPVTHSPHPGYPGIEPELPIALAKEFGYRTELNDAKNGVEIRFNGAVPHEITECLKANGFRYSGKCRVWYCKQTPDSRLFSRRLRG